MIPSTNENIYAVLFLLILVVIIIIGRELFRKDGKPQGWKKERGLRSDIASVCEDVAYDLPGETILEPRGTPEEAGQRYIARTKGTDHF